MKSFVIKIVLGITILMVGSLTGWAQNNIMFEPFTSFSWSASNSYTSKSDFIQNGQSWNSEKGIGFGSGNEFGILAKRSFDSSMLTVNAGVSALIGKKQQTYLMENYDSGQKVVKMMDAFQLNALLGIGLQNKFNNKILIGSDVLLVIPLITRFKEVIINKQGNINSQTSLQYKSRITVGLNLRCGIGYQLSEHLLIKGDVVYTFMSISNKSSIIRNYTSSDGTSLAQRYPTTSDLETIFYKDMKDVKNDPILNPSGFDKNKPSESISTQLPFSRMGLSISLVWILNLKNG